MVGEFEFHCTRQIYVLPTIQQFTLRMVRLNHIVALSLTVDKNNNLKAVKKCLGSCDSTAALFCVFVSSYAHQRRMFPASTPYERDGDPTALREALSQGISSRNFIQ